MMYNFQDLDKTPIPADQNWWLAFAPIVVVVILFYIIKKGMVALFLGNKFIARIFRISEERHLELMKRFEEQSIRIAQNKLSKKT